jgi:hypothetical protein
VSSLRAFTAGLVLWATAAAADPFVMETIRLAHRPLEQVVPLLRELVVPGGTVTGQGDLLIVRTTGENLGELKAVLASLDTPLRQLRITVSQDVAAHSEARADALAARVGEGAGIRYHGLATRGEEDRAHLHFVSAVEGTPAFIGVGQSLPLRAHSAVLTPHGAVVEESLEYRDVGAGFYVIPRLTGERVQLEISPFAEAPSRRAGGAIDAHGMTSTVSGRLGEWIPLGGATEARRDTGQGVTYGTRRRGSQGYDVRVKVEVLP